MMVLAVALELTGKPNHIKLISAEKGVLLMEFYINI